MSPPTQPPESRNATAPAEAPDAAVPRDAVIARAWAALGDRVAPLSNGSGRPLARTIKLVLDPLVIRPVQNPHLAGYSLTLDAADELARRIEDAGDELAGTAAWFLVLKRARRALRVTDGNPQEKYFQRCFELARTLGAPSADAADAAAAADQTAAAAVQEIAQAGGDSLLPRIRDLVHNPAEAHRLDAALEAAWDARRPEDADTAPRTTALIIAALDACGMDAVPELDALVDARSGSAAASALEIPGGAAALGLTAFEQLTMPTIGTTASKSSLPRPFDRSVFERLFAALSGGGAADVELDADEAVEEEIARTAQPWELAEEPSRVLMMLGVEAGSALEPGELPLPTSAHRLLRGRWEREAYVRRVRRLPSATDGVPDAIREDVRTVRQSYLRRLWVRLHGRELRGSVTSGIELWDTLDGVLRSVVMDQRHRLKLAIGRGAASGATLTGTESAA